MMLLHLQWKRLWCHFFYVLSFPFLHIRFGHLDKIHLESRATQSVTRVLEWRWNSSAHIYSKKALDAKGWLCLMIPTDQAQIMLWINMTLSFCIIFYTKPVLFPFWIWIRQYEMKETWSLYPILNYVINSFFPSPLDDSLG